MREWLVVGGGIAGVTAVQELVRVLVEAHSDARRGRRGRQAAAQAAFEPTRVTLLHASAQLQQIVSSTQHTEQLEEITAVGALDADLFLGELQAKLHEMQAEGTDAQVEVRLIRGTMDGLDTKSKDIFYTPSAAATAAESMSDASAPSASVAPLRLHYDKLCLCTGARPSLFLSLPSGVACPEQIVSIRDAASLAHLRSLLLAPAPGGRAKRVAIVGNGGIALELVHALRTGQLASSEGGGGVNTSDLVASAPVAASSAAVHAPMPPLSLLWVVRDPFLGNTFLDPMASAFLLPELFPESDPAGASAAANASRAKAAAAGGKDMSEEERIVSIEHGKHVRTILRGADGEILTGAANNTAAAASSASAHNEAAISSAAAPAAPAGAPSGAALGPNWLHSLYRGGDTNIPKYVLERERTKAASAAAASTSASQTDAPPQPPPFDLSLELCTEVSEVQILPAGAPFPLSLLLTSGRRFDVDLVVSATGVRPNTDWASEELKRGEHGGILVNERLETSVADVWAAGDCASLRFSPAFLAQHSEARPCLWHPMRLWSHAKLLGTYAARAMSGAYASELQELGGFNFMLFAHTTLLLGRKTILLGAFNLQGLGGPERVKALVASGALRTLVRCTPHSRTEFVKLHLLHGRIVGATLLGAPLSEGLELEETVENLMLNQTDLSEFGDFLNEVQVDLADFFD